MMPTETEVSPTEEEVERFTKEAEEARKKYYEPYKKIARQLGFTKKFLQALDIVIDMYKIPAKLPRLEKNALASKIIGEMIEKTGLDLPTIVDNIIKTKTI
jgi:N-formylglutamate amidohydrolase